MSNHICGISDRHSLFDTEFIHLRENKPASTYSISYIRKSLLLHDIDFNISASKRELETIFTNKVLNRRTELYNKIYNCKPSDDVIKDIN